LFFENQQQDFFRPLTRFSGFQILMKADTQISGSGVSYRPISDSHARSASRAVGTLALLKEYDDSVSLIAIISAKIYSQLHQSSSLDLNQGERQMRIGNFEVFIRPFFEETAR
jgi:hypothetical protein